MRISELKLGKYVVVNDLGASKYSSGMRVIGRVIKIDDNYNYAIIESLPNHRYEITDFNDFEYWSKSIEDKTESVSEVKKQPSLSKWLDNALKRGQEEFTNTVRQSNDLQQRKRNAPSHYEGEVDFLDYFFMQATPDEMRGAMKFTMGRYATRLGRKDDEVKELDKIIDYAQRYKEKLTK